MKIKIGLLCLAVAMGGLTVPAFAHDGTIGSAEDPVLLEDWGSVSVLHDPELYPWKGWAFITVKNSSLSNYWGDFHFEINGAGTDATQVYFQVTSPGGVVSSQNPFTANVGTNPNNGMSTLDLTFYDDPVAPGQIATFQIYTDNTAAENAWFGISMWPTPVVPEPASLLLLGMGGLFLARRRS